MSVIRNLFASVLITLMSVMTAAALDANISFTPNNVNPQEILRMRIGFTNPTGTPITSTTLSHTMNGVFLRTPTNVTSTCGDASLTGENTETHGTFTLTDATVSPNTVNNGICFIEFDVFTKTRGTRTITIQPGEVSAMRGDIATTNTQSASATLVTSMANPVITMTHLDGPYLSIGETSRINVKIDNTNRVPFSGMNVQVPITALLQSTTMINVVPEAQMTNTCGATGSVSRTTGISLSGGALSPNSSCDFTFAVEVVRDPRLPRALTNVNVNIPSGAVTIAEGLSNNTNHTLIVTGSSGVSLTKRMGNHAVLSQNITLKPLTRLRLIFENSNTEAVGPGTIVDPLPGGMIFDRIAWNSCGGTVSGIGTSYIVWNGTLAPALTNRRDVAESSVCEVQVDVRAPTSGSYVNIIQAGDIADYQFNQAQATLNASEGTLSVSMTMRNMMGGTSASWGDRVILKFRFKEESGDVTINNLQVPISMYTSGFKYEGMQNDTCGLNGTVTVEPGVDKASDQITYHADHLSAGATCEVSFTYQSLPDATNLQLRNGTTAIPENQISYEVNGQRILHGMHTHGGFARMLTPIQVHTTFAPVSVGSGGLSRTRNTISLFSEDNNSVHDMFLTTTLSGGLLVDNEAATPGNIINTCGGTVTAVPGTNTLTLEDGAFSSPETSSTCYFEVPVRAPLLTSGQTQSTGQNVVQGEPLEGSGTRFRALMNVNVPEENREIYNGLNSSGTLTWRQHNVQVTRSFTPTIVDGGVNSQSSITISNTAANAVPLSNVAFIDDLRGTDLRVASHPNVRLSNCDAEVTALPHTQVVTVENGSVPEGRQCVIQYNVYSPTGGNHTVTLPAGALFSDEAISNGANASATLTVLRNINVSAEFSQNLAWLSAPVDVMYTLYNTNIFPVFGEAGALDVTAGDGPVTNASSTCPGMTLTVIGNRITSEGGEIPAGGTCEVRARISTQSAAIKMTQVPAGGITFHSVEGVAIQNVTPSQDEVIIAQEPVISAQVLNASGTVTDRFSLGDTGRMILTIAHPNTVVALRDVTPISRRQGVPEGVEITNMHSTCPNTVRDAYPAITEMHVRIAQMPPQSQCVITYEFRTLAEGAVSFDHEVLTGGALTTDYTLSSARTAASMDTSTIHTGEPLEVSMTPSRDMIAVSEEITLTVRVRNPNSVSTSLSRVENELSAGLRVVPGSLSSCAFLGMNEEQDKAIFGPDSRSIDPEEVCELSFRARAVAVGPQTINTKLFAIMAPGDLSTPITVVPLNVDFDLTKISDVDAVDAADQDVQWSVNITNTGNVPLSFGDVTDTLTLSSGQTVLALDGDRTPLPVDETRTLTAVTTVTQDMLDAETELHNAVEVTMIGPDGDARATRFADATVPLVRTPALLVVQSSPSDLPAFPVAGDAFTWTAVITNTSNVSYPAANVTFTHARPDAIISIVEGPAEGGVFAPGASYVLSISDKLAEEDIDAGEVMGTLTAGASSAVISDVTASDSDTLAFTPNAAPLAADVVMVTTTLTAPVIIDVMPSVADVDGNLMPSGVRLLDGADEVTSLTVLNEGTYTVDVTDGTVTFAPLSGFARATTPITYVVRDSRDAVSNTATITISYDPILPPNVEADLLADLPTNAPVTVDVLANDSAGTYPIDAGSLRIGGETVRIVDGQGEWRVVDAQIRFTPAQGFTGQPLPVIYTVRDTMGNESAPAEVILLFTAQAPIAANDVLNDVETRTAAVVNVLLNDFDPDGALDAESVIILNAPLDGKVMVVSGEGTWIVDTGTIIFVPVAGFTSSPTPVSYTVADNDGNRSDAATVTITYAPRAPLAQDVTQDGLPTTQLVSIDMTAHVSDPDGAVDLDSLTLVGAPDDGRNLSVDGEGLWEIAGNGIITFQPAAGFTRDPAPVSYTVRDNDGNLSNAGLITLVFAPQAPIARDDVENGVPFGQGATVNVLMNDENPDGDLDTSSVRIDSATGPVETLLVDGEGRWDVVAGGAVQFTPVADLSAAPRPITYTVADTDGNRSAPATITILFAPRVPFARADIAHAAFGEAVTIDVTANDLDPDTRIDARSVQIVNGTDDGTRLVVSGEGVWSVDAEGRVTFTPNADIARSPTPVSYTVADVDGERSADASITIIYDARLPIAQNDAVIDAPHGAPVRVNVLANDVAFEAALDPASIMLVGSDDGKELVVANEGVWAVTTEGDVIFSADLGYFGRPSPVTYTVADLNRNVSTPASISVEFAVRIPLSVADRIADLPYGTVAALDVLVNDVTTDADLDAASVRIVGPADDGRSLAVVGEGVWSVSDAGVITFTPSAGLRGNPAQISYTVADVNGVLSEPATVSVEYVVRAPIAVADSVADLPYGTVAAQDVLSNDIVTDADLNAASVRIVSAADDGRSLAVAGEGVWSVSDAGVITFTPSADLRGNPAPIGYIVADVSGATSDAASVSVTYLEQIVIAPVTDDISITVARPNTLAEIVVLDHATAGSAPVDAQSVRIDGADAENVLVIADEGVWSVQLSGTIVFTPADNFYGDPPPARYSVADVEGVRSDSALITIDYVQDARLAGEVLTSVTDANDNGVADAGDVVTYTLRVRNLGNVPLANVTFTSTDGMTCAPIALPVGAEGELSCAFAVITLTAQDAQRGSVSLTGEFSADSIMGVLSVSDSVRVEVAAATPDVPVTPETPAINVSVSKVAEVSGGVETGQNVPYLITVTNRDAENAVSVDVIDRLPAGLSFVEHSGRIGTQRVNVVRNGADVIFDDVVIPAGGQAQIRIQAVVTDFSAGVTNIALVTDPEDRGRVVASTQAVVEEDRPGAAVFDCAVVLGRVFTDRNGNGWMDEGEAGIADVRVVTARGLSIFTDAHGRFSVPCPQTPSAIGSNMVLKVDPASLPAGHTVATENPLVVRLMPGRVTDASFGVIADTPAEAPRVAEISVDASAFVGTDLSDSFKAALRQSAEKALVNTFNFVYDQGVNEDDAEAQSRAQAIYAFMREFTGIQTHVGIRHK